MLGLWVVAVGGLGAVGRFVADGLLRTVLGRVFPWATLIINVSGSFLLGVVTGLAAHHAVSSQALLIIGTGFCGGFTTFSTASFETARLLESRRFGAAAAQALGNLACSFLAAWIGCAAIK